MAFKLHTRCQSQRDFTPVSWSEYFDEAHDILINSSKNQCNEKSKHNNSPDSFRVYMKNFCPPYSPQRLVGSKQPGSNAKDMTHVERKNYSQYPTLVALHGGGYSGLTWAQFTKNIEQNYHCRILAIDLRSHGDTKTADDEKMDMDTLVEDVVQVVQSAHELCGFHEMPTLVLIGHSMGGAIAIRCSCARIESLPSIVGFVVIDVVEGTAKEALPLMMTVIRTRPNRFPSLANAIEWSVRSGMAKNVDAARVSMPGNLLNITTGHLSIHDVEEKSSIIKHKFHIGLENLLIKDCRPKQSSLPANLPLPTRVVSLRVNTEAVKTNFTKDVQKLKQTNDVIINSEMNCSSSHSSESDQSEDNSDKFDSEGYKHPPEVNNSGFCWRTDLAKTQPHWPGWFEGLSQQMLDAPVLGKFLLLAGIDRLDKTLTIGQMQGKFMMKILPKCGHAVHEDSPGRVAEEIGQFLVRNKFTTAKVATVNL